MQNNYSDPGRPPQQGPSPTLEFDGERFIPDRTASEIDLEHYHRYTAIADAVRGKVVLDVASGAGYGTKILGKFAKEVTGADVAHEAVASAIANYSAPNVRFVQADCTDLPFENASFDVVTSFETIEHITAHDAFLDECARVLRPHGVLIISTPERNAYNAQLAQPNVHHLKELSQDEFQRLLSKRFANVAMVGQRVVFGSLIVGAGANGALESLHGSAPAAVDRTRAHDRSIYLIATCSNGPIPQFPAGIYEGSFPPNALSSLLGGIRERDETIAKAAAARSDAQKLIDRLEAHLSAINEELKVAQLASLDAQEEIAFGKLALAESRLVAEMLRVKLDTSKS